MKSLKLKLILHLLVIFSSLKVIGQTTYVGDIDRFTVNSGWQVQPNTSSTTINFTVRYLRTANNSSWNPFNMNIKLGIATYDGAAVDEYLSGVYNVTSSDFTTNNSTVDVQYSVTVNNSKMVHNHYLVIDYNIPNNGSTYYQRYGGYSYQISNSPNSPQPPTAGEGLLLRTPDQKIYHIIDGYARHIQNWATLAGVYDYSENIINVTSLFSPIGSPIDGNTSLLRNTSDQKLYFREGTYLRHIVSEKAAVLYNFKIHNNQSNILNVSSTTGYTIGSPLNDW